MSWRPEKWFTIKHKIMITLDDSPFPVREAVEAGADAILEAQRDMGIPWPPPDSINGFMEWALIALLDTRILYGDVKGKMVFIPDETKR